jgi:hypothetical protein
MSCTLLLWTFLSLLPPPSAPQPLLHASALALHPPIAKTQRRTVRTPSKSARKLALRRSSRRPPLHRRRPQRAIPRWTLLQDTLLDSSLRYRMYQVAGAHPLRLHLLNFTPTPTTELRLIPALPNRAEPLPELIARCDSTLPDATILAAVNGYFWSARASPVGLAASEGEALQLHRYKRWSSIAVDRYGRATIDTFLLELSVRFPSGAQLPIVGVNRRKDTAGVVLYTRFAGDTIPPPTCSCAPRCGGGAAGFGSCACCCCCRAPGAADAQAAAALPVQPCAECPHAVPCAGYGVGSGLDALAGLRTLGGERGGCRFAPPSRRHRVAGEPTAPTAAPADCAAVQWNASAAARRSSADRSRTGGDRLGTLPPPAASPNGDWNRPPPAPSAARRRTERALCRCHH